MNINWQNRFWLATSLVLAMAAGAGIAKAQSSEKQSDDYYELMRVFVDTFEQIDRNYVKEVDRRKLVDAAVRGMLSELDPYSDYFGPEEVKEFTESVEQEFSGVGIRVKFDEPTRSIEVTAPLPGSPAYEAGIHAGDRIVEIEGKPVKDFPSGREIDTAVEMLRGKEGEPVTVAVVAVGETDPKQITLKRAIITLDTVMGYSYNEDGTWNFFFDKENKIGYLRLTHFTRRSASEMRDALRTLKRDGMKGLVLDLRFNPGGLLQAAVEVADLFIDGGEIVRTEGRNVPSRTYSAKSWGTYTGFPMAVLINRYSASASEIVSACLQDHHRAVIVGERSWGKGSVQNVIDLEDGKAALKLTTASYHRPSGKNIHRFPGAGEDEEWGVSPDPGYEVKFSIDEMRAYQRDRRARDIPNNRDEVEMINFDDRQLDRAMAYVRSQVAPPEDSSDEKPASEEEKPKAEAPKVEKDKKAAAVPFLRFNSRESRAA